MVSDREEKETQQISEEKGQKCDQIPDSVVFEKQEMAVVSPTLDPEEIYWDVKNEFFSP